MFGMLVYMSLLMGGLNYMQTKLTISKFYAAQTSIPSSVGDTFYVQCDY